jgi:hypothetical protein
VRPRIQTPVWRERKKTERPMLQNKFKGFKNSQSVSGVAQTVEHLSSKSEPPVQTPVPPKTT